MNNPTLDLIHAHGSVHRYKPDPVPASAVETIIATGQRASTSPNMQVYSVTAVTDDSARSTLKYFPDSLTFIGFTKINKEKIL